MRRAPGYCIAALAAMNIALLAFLFWRPQPAAIPEANEVRLHGKLLAAGVRFTVYVGLNDKDAGEQIVTTSEAKARLNAIASKHVGGFTVRHAEGYWTNAAGEAENEETLVYDFLDATDAQVAAIVAQMKTAMNQEAILVERSGTTHVFY